MKYIKALYPLIQFLLVTIVVVFMTTFITLLIMDESQINETLLSITWSIITGIILLPIFARKYDEKKIEQKGKKIENINYISLGISLSLVINIIYLLTYKILNIEYSTTNEFIILTIITTVFIGPILEEYLFRGLIFNNLKEIQGVKKSAIITIVIFSLLHVGLTSFITAIILGSLLMYIYIIEENINEILIVHIFFNLTTIIYRLFVVDLSNEYLIPLILVSLVLLIKCLYIIFNLKTNTEIIK